MNTFPRIIKSIKKDHVGNIIKAQYNIVKELNIMSSKKLKQNIIKELKTMN